MLHEARINVGPRIVNPMQSFACRAAAQFNLAAAGNARSAFLFAIVRLWPGVPEPQRWQIRYLAC